VIYWDTSCLIKLYVAEPDSDVWQEFLSHQSTPGGSSALLQSELAYALRQKEARKEVRKGSATRLVQAFQKHVEMGRFDLFPVGSDVLELSVAVAKQCYAAKPAVPLRTLDGIHLATAILVGCSAVATTDQRMLSALPLLDLRAAKTGEGLI
jgi:predicted nucleic acid-binding protein